MTAYLIFHLVLGLVVFVAMFWARFFNHTGNDGATFWLVFSAVQVIAPAYLLAHLP